MVDLYTQRQPRKRILAYLAIVITVAAVAVWRSSGRPALVTSNPPAPGAPAAAGSGEDLAEKMRHCPVTLPGVRTTVVDVDGGIRLVLRASRSEVVAEAQKRARELVAFTAGRSKEKHGGGRGGGFMRNCPIVTRDAKVAASDDPNGVTITVTPNDPGDVAEVRAKARERLDRAPLERASVVREESAPGGETRLYSGGVADLDGDGTLELVVAGFASDGKGHRSTIGVYRRSGDTWMPVTEYSWVDGEGSSLRNVQLADLDGDGKVDIVTLGKVGATSHAAKARLAVLDLENGKLVLRAQTEWQHGQYTHGYGLAIADLDGDRRPEIVSGGFQFDGTNETGYVRVWSLSNSALALRAEAVLDGQGSSSMRVNDIAIGDLDGDGHPDIVVAGRHSPLKTNATKEHLDLRREIGDLSVLAFTGDKLAIKARYSWSRGTSLRLRTVVVADLDGDHRPDIVTGGQYDADGKPALALFGYDRGKLVLRDDASSAAEGITGEVKDLVVVGEGAHARIVATGVSGDKPGRQGDVASWRLDHGKLAAESAIVSRNGEETRARAVIIVPDDAGPSVFTIGHAKTETATVGQVLAWHLTSIPR